jgi:nijmegen breakage syndrome protein 1
LIFLGKVFFLKPDKQIYVIGRIADLILDNDNSISRQHSQITVENDKIYIEDLGSKYGTFINEKINTVQKIEAKKKIPLTDNDRILFGRLENIWVLSKLNYKIVSSTVLNLKDF